ncbi:MAG: hypothetical protein V3S69_06245 [Dehalococcoidales bacterium]
MAKKSLSKIKIELDNAAKISCEAKAGVAQRETKRAKTKAVKAAKEAREMSEYIAAEMEGEV